METNFPSDPQPGHRFKLTCSGKNLRCIDCRGFYPNISKTCYGWTRNPNLCRGCKKDLGSYFKYWHCKDCRVAWYKSQSYGYQTSNSNENRP